MDDRFSLTGQRVLVTGASSGIGAAVVERLAGAGAHVVAVARRPDRLEALAARCAGRVEPVPADLADPDAPEVVVRRAVAALGGLDVLVNNAARADWLPFTDVDRARFDAVLGLNLWVPLRLVQLTRSHLSASGRGLVVNIGSIDAVRPSAGAALYGASKAGLRALTVVLAKELAADGVVVCQVDPGLVRTPLAADVVAGVEASGRAVNLAGRVGEPDEVAGLVHYLASPSGRFTTGTALVLDGGALAAGPYDAAGTVPDR